MQARQFQQFHYIHLMVLFISYGSFSCLYSFEQQAKDHVPLPALVAVFFTQAMIEKQRNTANCMYMICTACEISPQLHGSVATTKAQENPVKYWLLVLIHLRTLGNVLYCSDLFIVSLPCAKGMFSTKYLKGAHQRTPYRPHSSSSGEILCGPEG